MVQALREHGLIERALVSTTFMRSLVAVRALEPRLRLGWSVPRARKDYTRSWLYRIPAYAAIGRIKRRLPDAAREHLAAGRCDALMVHWRLVTARLVEAVGEAGGELYVWTVDDARPDPAARGHGRHGGHHQRSEIVCDVQASGVRRAIE